mgnify:CR=1 FL=1
MYNRIIPIPLSLVTLRLFNYIVTSLYSLMLLRTATIFALLCFLLSFRLFAQDSHEFSVSIQEGYYEQDVLIYPADSIYEQIGNQNLILQTGSLPTFYILNIN